MVLIVVGEPFVYLPLSVTSFVDFLSDEAHRATGNYAYCQVVRYMMAKNPHFRLLALTATPGSKPEAVQAIIDSLHISHIELRDESALDLRDYIFKKVQSNLRLHLSDRLTNKLSQKTEICVIEMTENILKIREPLLKLMQVCNRTNLTLFCQADSTRPEGNGDTFGQPGPP